MAHCRFSFVDSNSNPFNHSRLYQTAPGILNTFLERIVPSNDLLPVAAVVRRSVYEALDGYDTQLPHTSDYEMWVRIAVNYPVWFEPEILACYRMHDSQETPKYEQSALDIDQTLTAIEIAGAYLPSWLSRKGCSGARVKTALRAMDVGCRYLAEITMLSP